MPAIFAAKVKLKFMSRNSASFVLACHRPVGSLVALGRSPLAFRLLLP